MFYNTFIYPRQWWTSRMPALSHLHSTPHWQGSDTIHMPRRGNDAGLVVADNFLSPTALDALRTVALESTLFYDARATYLGACVAPTNSHAAKALNGRLFDGCVRSVLVVCVRLHRASCILRITLLRWRGHLHNGLGGLSRAFCLSWSRSPRWFSDIIVNLTLQTFGATSTRVKVASKSR